MKKRVLVSILFLSTIGTFMQAEEVKKESPITIYGFVRNDMYLDTYKGVNIGSEIFNVVPSFDGKIDASGRDINEETSYNLTSIATRVGLKINGPEFLGSKTNAVIEGDFCGTFTDGYIALFRIRQAKVLMNWSKSTLTVGMDWHPFWGGKYFPIVGSMNTGAPFQPFNRSPLIRFDYRKGKFTLTAAQISELIFRSYGPIGKSDQYSRNAVMPELYLGSEFHNGGLTLGIGASYKPLKPYTQLLDNQNKSYHTNALVNSFMGMGFGYYTSGDFQLLAKAVIGQNTANQLIPGGYAVSYYDKTEGNPSIGYTNFTTFSAFVNPSYGKKWQGAIFAGYLQNLGTSSTVLNEASMYGFVPNLHALYRVSPSLSLNINRIKIIGEYEFTMAAYGVGNFRQADGLYDGTHYARNHRVFISMVYNF